MYDEVLETDRYPEILYECSQVSASVSDGRHSVTLDGELTLHGVTQRLPVPANVVVSGDLLRASGDFSLRQSDYGILPITVAAGALRVKSFDIVARKQG